MSKKKSLETRTKEFELKLDIKGYDLVGNYLGNEIPVEIRHRECGLVFETVPHTFNRKDNSGYCNNCYFTKNQTFENFSFKMEKYFPGHYSYNEEDYIGYSNKMLITHKCGREMYLQPSAMIKRAIQSGRDFVCKICSLKEVYPTDYVKKEIDEFTNGEYTMIGEYTNEDTPITLVHNTCGKLYTTTTRRNFIYNGNRCPDCMMKFSKRERILMGILDDNNIEYEYNYKVDSHKMDSSRRFYKYDFYIKDLDLIIEVDGDQHFAPWGGNKTSLENINKYISNFYNDNLKNDIIEYNSLRMLRISYRISLKDISELYMTLIREKEVSSTTIEKYNDLIMYIDNGKIYNEDLYYTSRVQPSDLGRSSDDINPI